MALYEGDDVLLDYTNDTGVVQDVMYASITAPERVRCVVTVDDVVIDVVYVASGSSHSWWSSGGGKLLQAGGLQPGSRLLIRVNGPAAMRVDWQNSEKPVPKEIR